MRRIILLITALVCSTQLFAQYSGRVTSTHGTVVEKVTVITIEPEVVEEEKVEEEEDVFEPISYPKYDAKIGYQQEISLGWWIATYWDSSSALRLSYVGGKRFNNYFFAGLGAGLDIATGNAHKAVVEEHGSGHLIENRCGGRVCFGLPVQRIAIPIYANFKVYMARTKFAPYLSFSFGGRFSSSKTLTFKWRYNDDTYQKYGIARPFFDFALGANIRKSKTLSYTFQLGYYTQNGDYFKGFMTSGRQWTIDRQYWGHGLKLSVGMTF